MHNSKCNNNTDIERHRESVDYYDARPGNDAWLLLHGIYRVTTLQTQKSSPAFPGEIAGNMSNKCTNLREHNVWKLNVRTNKLHVSYFVELPQSNFPTKKTPWPFPDLSRIPWHFQKSGHPGFAVRVVVTNEPGICDESSEANCHAMLTIHADEDGTVRDKVDSSIARGVDVDTALDIRLERSMSDCVVKGPTATLWLLWFTTEHPKNRRVPNVSI